VPTGGAAGQVLAKINATDYNTQWVAQSGGIADAPNDGGSYGRKNLNWTPVMPIAGGTFTGTYNVDCASPFFYINGRAAGGTLGTWYWAADWLNRWAMGVNAQASGANFFIERYDDAGNWVNFILTASRSTGVVDFKATPTVNGVPIGGGGATITMSDAPPSSPSAGAMWFSTLLGILFLYYNDGDSSQWIQAIPSGVPDAPTDGQKYVRKDGTWVLA
jgi:hypothetical protein